MILFALMLVVVFYVFFASAARRHDAERRATEAQLRLLQGQIEPHFLFNTLANVISLMDHDLPKARRVLLSFTEYLRSALGSLRRDEGPLAQELDLAEHYLRLAQARMEDRLRYSIEADPRARAVPVPPLLLQPLVENAVVHGLEPAIEGGQVRLRAQLEGRWLVLEVHDDGARTRHRAAARHRPRHGAGQRSQPTAVALRQRGQPGAGLLGHGHAGRDPAARRAGHALSVAANHPLTANEPTKLRTPDEPCPAPGPAPAVPHPGRVRASIGPGTRHRRAAGRPA
jgi:hypothetical protein